MRPEVARFSDEILKVHKGAFKKNGELKVNTSAVARRKYNRDVYKGLRKLLAKTPEGSKWAFWDALESENFHPFYSYEGGRPHLVNPSWGGSKEWRL